MSREVSTWTAQVYLPRQEAQSIVFFCLSLAKQSCCTFSWVCQCPKLDRSVSESRGEPHFFCLLCTRFTARCEATTQSRWSTSGRRYTVARPARCTGASRRRLWPTSLSTSSSSSSPVTCRVCLSSESLDTYLSWRSLSTQVDEQPAIYPLP